MVKTDSDGWKTVAYGSLVPYLVEAVKLQDETMKRQNRTIEELEKQVVKLQDETTKRQNRTIEELEKQVRELQNIVGALSSSLPGNSTA